MSSLNYLNKENTNVNAENAENAVVRLKLAIDPKLRRAGPRIPLGGKNLNSNSGFPSTLQKSKSTLQSDFKVQRKKILLPKAPALSKANSSLGFIHRPIENQPNPPKKQQPQKLDTKDLKASRFFHHQFSQRSKNLTGETETDSLVKKQIHQNLPPIGNLKDTLSENTSELHASNIPSQEIVGDPLKGQTKPKSHMLRDSLIDELAEDPNSIETLPPHKQQRPYTPIGMEPFSKDDLDFFSQPSRLSVTEDNHYEYEEIHKNEMRLKFKEIDLENPKNFGFQEEEEEEVNAKEKDQADDLEVGLTTQELNDLLDF